MPEIVLTEEQVKQFDFRPVPIVVKNPAGQVVGHLDPLPSAEYIADTKRRLATPGPRYSSAAVAAMLDALQTERDRIGPFDAAYAEAFVCRLEVEDPKKYGPTEGL